MKRCIFLIALCLCVFINSNSFAQLSIITTIAGNGTAGFSGDGGAATAAELNGPSDVFKDAAGNLYIADRGNNRIRKINTGGIISTIIGTGVAGYTGDGGSAATATLNGPNRVFVTGAGNIYIADQGNNVIRMVNGAGIISTIAGTGVAGFSGDGGAATSAKLSSPTGVAVDATGNVFISDLGNNRVRKINTSGIISTYAGGGSGGFTTDGVPATSITLCSQEYVSVDNSGTIYITNRGCWHFLKVTVAGLIYNVAGSVSPSFSGDCGPADSADVQLPYGITPDNLGNVYLCPRGNVRVRRVNTLNYINTVAGTGVNGYSGDGGQATNAKVSNTIYGIYADMSGNIYFADMGNNRIRTFNISSYNSTDTLCQGGLDTLTSTAGAGSWSSSNTLVATIGASSGIVTAVSAGTAVMTYSAIACPEIILFDVTAPVDTSESLCVGTTVNLGTGTWSSTNTSVATVNVSSGLVTAVAPGTATISNASAACSAVFYFTVSAPVTTAETVCSGSSLTLSGSIGGTWTSSNASVANVGSSSGVVTGFTAGVATITCTGSPCPSLFSVTVVTAHDTAESVCVGSAIVLTGSGGGGSWTSGNTAVATVDPASGIVTGIASGVAVITYSSTPCPEIFHITVVAPTSTPESVCIGSSIALTGSAGGTWNSTNTSIATVDPSTCVVTGVATGLATISCSGSPCPAIFQVTVNPVPVLTTGSVCAGSSTTLTSSISLGTWSSGSPVIATVNPATGYVNGLSAGTAAISFTSNLGCIASVPFIVKPVPSVIAGPSSLCVGYSITLSNTLAGGTWSSSNPVLATIDPSSGMITGLSVGTVTITYTSAGGCFVTTPVEVRAAPAQLTIMATDSAICLGSYITFTGYVGGALLVDTGYTWKFGFFNVSNMNPVIYAPDLVGPNNITLNLHFPGCQTDSVTRTIFVTADPVVNLGEDVSICTGSTTIVLSNKINESNTSAKWIWNTGQVTPQITVSQPGYYYVTVTINGCSSSDSVWVQNGCYANIPNVFTPNGDGINDYFFPFQYMAAGLVTVNMTIYNRWGTVVYQTTSTTGNGWDGKYNNVPQPEGVFVYIIDAVFKDGQKEHYQGNLTLMR